MLGVLGDLVEDVVVWPAGPIAPGTDTAARVFRRRGGSAANVAAHAAGLAPVLFLGRVGDDDAGRALTASLVRAGVDVRVQRSGTTGTVVVLVDAAGERTMLPDRAAAVALRDPSHAWSAGLTHLHLPAYSLVEEPIGTAARTVAGRVRDAGGTISVDVSSVGAVQAFGVARFDAVLADLGPAHVLATREEAELVGLSGAAAGSGAPLGENGARSTPPGAGQGPPGGYVPSPTVSGAGQRSPGGSRSAVPSEDGLWSAVPGGDRPRSTAPGAGRGGVGPFGPPAASACGPVVVVKDGPRPTRVLVPGSEPEEVPVPEVDGVRDTTGAGDAFAAGYLVAVLDGVTPADACRVGHRLAASVLTSAGA